MQKTIEAMRLALTIIGLILLFVFGSRAASQARNMKLAGETPRHSILNPSFSVADMTRLNPLFSGVSTAESLLAPLTSPSQASHSTTAAAASSTVPATTNDNAAAATQAQPGTEQPPAAVSSDNAGQDSSIVHDKPSRPTRQQSLATPQPPVPSLAKEKAADAASVSN